MKFIHTSDWHLGRTLHGKPLIEDQEHLLGELERLLADEKPDVLLVAGDVYDRSVPPVSAVERLDGFLSRVVLERKIPVVMISGNHDSGGRLSFGAQLLTKQGLHVFGAVGSTGKVELPGKYGLVGVFGLPFADPPDVRGAGLSGDAKTHDEALKAQVEHCVKLGAGKRSIALAHAFVTGGKVSDSERDLAVGGSAEVSALHFSAFGYTALGHLHTPQEAGSEKVRYSGSLMKYSFSEASGKRGAIVGELRKDGTVKTRFAELKPKHELRTIEGLFEDIRTRKADDGPVDDYVACTLLDKGFVLDAMGRLRETYPNILHLEYASINQVRRGETPRVDPRKAGRLELFDSFMKDTTGEELSADERTALAEVIKEAEAEAL